MESSTNPGRFRLCLGDDIIGCSDCISNESWLQDTLLVAYPFTGMFSFSGLLFYYRVTRMHIKSLFAQFGIFALLISFFVPFNSNAAERWYNEAQVNQGNSIFTTNCAICHGSDAGSTPEWRKSMADGRYPPPPLNGTAHAWHHNLESLQRQINQGGIKYQGWMPAFADSLNAEQVEAVIAYFQSLWPDDIYAAWLEKNQAQPGNSLVTQQAGVESESNEILLHLSRRLPNSKFGKPQETPLKGIFRLSMDDSIIYVSSDGRYVFLGDMVDLVVGRNFSKTGVP